MSNDNSTEQTADNAVQPEIEPEIDAATPSETSDASDAGETSDTDAPAAESVLDVPPVVQAIEAPATLAAIDAPAVLEAIEAPAVLEAIEAPAAAADVTADVVEPAEPSTATVTPAVPDAAPVEPEVAAAAATDVAPVEPEVAAAAATDVAPAEPDTAVTAPVASSALAGMTRPAPPRPVAPTTRPGASATVAPETSAPETAPETPSDSLRFGRVDDDGTVHVRLADGTEQPVGLWAAGTPTEGLTFFVRKYDDLSVEVDLAMRRLSEGKTAPEQAAVVVKRARESLASPSMVGDLASLTERVDALDILVVERRAVAAELRATAKAAALEAREAIVAEAENLALSTQWKATGERFKTLLDDWKGAPRADRASEQALWKRFSHARSQFDKHRRQYFARLDSERGEAKQVKESLVAEAEALTNSTDWGATAGAYRDLMTSWKASGHASKSEEDELWTRFRAAQDAFFEKRNAALGQRDAGFAENLAAKELLLVEAEAINIADLKSAKATLRSVQERWEQIGHVPRGDKERIEARLRRVEESMRRDEQDQWRRSNPEAKARAEATVEQFQGSLAKMEKARAAAEAKGDARALADVEGRIATTLTLLDAAQKAVAEFSG